MMQLLMLLAVALSILNLSGLGQTYHTWRLTSVIFVILALGILLHYRGRFRLVETGDFVAIWCVVLAFVLVPLLVMCTGIIYMDGLSYLVAFCVVFVFRSQKLRIDNIQFMSLVVCIIGLWILYVYDNTEILDGWNMNTIAMIGLFNYLVFYAAIGSLGRVGFKVISVCVTLTCLSLLAPTESRSAQLTVVIAIIMYLCRKPLAKLLRYRFVWFTILQIPLMIAAFVLIMSHSESYEQMNRWSEAEYEKSMFSGRDIIWEDAMSSLWDRCFEGVYVFSVNYHNSSIGCLATFGIFGYVAWIYMLMRLIRPLRLHISDPLIYGMLSAFLLIYVQQSVELGLILAQPNLVPYMILGIGQSRARQLKSSQ